MGLKVEILVRVHGLPVNRDIQIAIFSSPEKHVKERECHIFFMLHSELDGWPYPVEMARSSAVEPFLRMQKVSSTYLFHNMGLAGIVSSASSSKNSM